MLYCEKCMKIVEGQKCGGCKSQKLREPKTGDPVFLMEKDAVIAASVEDILSQNGIPCLKRGLLGAGITAHIGYNMETFRFYIPFGAYEEAKELLANFLTD